ADEDVVDEQLLRLWHPGHLGAVEHAILVGVELLEQLIDEAVPDFLEGPAVYQDVNAHQHGPAVGEEDQVLSRAFLRLRPPRRGTERAAENAGKREQPDRRA